MPRPDGRSPSVLRPVRLVRGCSRFAEGSCQVEFGETKVLCTASWEDRVPPFLKGTGGGWVTAEYAMLPRATKTRTPRDVGKAPSGRTVEIQRLIGRSLRAVTDLNALGERSIYLDCDVLQADGGTRTAAITGAYVALVDCIERLRRDGALRKSPIKDQLAAVSVGIVGGQVCLDLCYEEDSAASVDMNVIMTGQGKFVEVQGTAEGEPFDRSQLDRLLEVAQKGLNDLFELQREALGQAARPR